jgi:hypothetical protein
MHSSRQKSYSSKLLPASSDVIFLSTPPFVGATGDLCEEVAKPCPCCSSR